MCSTEIEIYLHQNKRYPNGSPVGLVIRFSPLDLVLYGLRVQICVGQVPATLTRSGDRLIGCHGDRHR